MSAGLPRDVRVAFAAALAGILVYAGLTIAAALDDPGIRLPAKALYVALYLLPAWLCAKRALAADRERLVWAFYAAAFALWGVGYALYFALVANNSAPPSPSLADAAWLSYYPFAFAALVLLTRARIPPIPRSMALDGAVLGLVVTAFTVQFVLDPLVEAGGATTAAALTALSYPALELVLLLIVGAAVALVPWHLDRVFATIALGHAVNFVANWSYALRETSGNYMPSTLADLAWPAGLAIIAAAAWMPRGAPSSDPPDERRVVAAPVLAGVAAVLLLVYGNFTSLGDAAFATVLLGLGLAIARIILTLRETRGLRDLAMRDPLTGLLNRRGFYAFLESDGASNGSVAMLMADLDRFKAINDVYGHDEGDRLLVEVAAGLSGEAGAASAVARLGGDEFAIAMPGIGRDEAVATAKAIAAAPAACMTAAGEEIEARLTVGVATARHPYQRGELLSQADSALIEAKSQARGSVRVFDAQLREHQRDRDRLLLELRAARRAGQLVVHYQPIVHLGSQQVVGAEALVRWEHPDRGLLPPGEFIDLAEQSGAIVEVGRCVFEKACAQAVAWDRWGLSISVNLSRHGLADPELCTHVEEVLRETGVERARTVFELTETAVVEDVETTTRVLGELRALGVRIAMDDFGTGYSSLSQLRRLPIDVLKIDRPFVAGIASDREEWALADAIVRLAVALEKQTLAEGVETGAQFAHLRALGCDLGQGFLFSPPLPAPEFERHLEQEHELRGS